MSYSIVTTERQFTAVIKAKVPFTRYPRRPAVGARHPRRSAGIARR
jgi:hypothetical protein